MNKQNYYLISRSLKKLGMLVAIFSISLTAMGQDITSGLILHYDFDAISGTTVPDLSGNGKVGTVVGAPTAVDGYSGQGLNMMTKADYVNLPADINVGLTSFTYATWVNFSALKNAVRFFDLGNGADATNNFLAFVPSFNGDNQVMCMRYRPATGTSYNVLSTSKVPVGSWAHVAVTFNWDEATQTAAAKIYLNGADVTNYTATPSANSLPYNPSLSLGSTTANNYLGISRWAQDINGFNGTIDDVRFYNRALTATDILTLNGMAELNKQWSMLELGDLTAVTEDIELPTTLGTNGVTVRWASSNNAVVDTFGHVIRPEKYNKSVTLTATLSQMVGNKVYNLSKSFKVKVLGVIETPQQIATFNFDSETVSVENDTVRVIDTQSGFKGKIMNEARIRTIGNTDRKNVLDLGSGKGYFDMGQEIGRAIYALDDYTMMGYYRVDENYANLAAGGNYYWNFSNSADVGKYANGFMYGRLNAQAAGISAAGSPSVAVNPNSPAVKGEWHHFAYTQQGTTGIVYVDGVEMARRTDMPITSTTIAKDSMQGTICNWLGRSGWSADAYLQQTLLYDFRILSIPVNGDDINLGFDGFEPVTSVIQLLNNAYAENPDYIAEELQTEFDDLSLGDLSNVTENITLPTKGKTDENVSIKWKSSNPALITNTGEVTRPDFYSYNATLTATLMKDGQVKTKTFDATVAVKEGTQFNNDLLVKHDFSNYSYPDTVVFDAAEKQFKATLMNDANINTMGTTKTYKVLNLGDSIGYLDLGPEIGKLMYNLDDYTMSAYYRVENDTTVLRGAGNFIWTFSNTDNAMSNRTGYIIGSLLNQSVSITPAYYEAATGNQAIGFATPALKGDWHHFAYTQSGTSGTVYIDGIAQAVGEITNLPKTTLPKAGMLGTPFNWIGRSNYITDAYLRKTLVYDFRLYRKALTEAEIQTSEFNVQATIDALNVAYSEGLTSVKKIADSKYSITSTQGKIQVKGLSASDKVNVFDISGRKIQSTTQSEIWVKAGVYIVKINNEVNKVIVK